MKEAHDINQKGEEKMMLLLKTHELAFFCKNFFARDGNS